VAASIGALFYAQALKRKTLLLKPGAGTVVFAPSGGGARYNREAHFPFKLTLGGDVVVSILTATDRTVDVIVRRPLREYHTLKLHWNGRNSSGAMVPAGYYLLQIHVLSSGQTFIAPGFRLHLLGGAG
jgi:hypothetical protein